MFTRAICRKPGLNFSHGITTVKGGKPDYAKMMTQHDAYVDALKKLGLQVEVLEPLGEFPDAYFVEDAAIVTPELAIITRPGAKARRGEAAAMEPVLVKYRPLARIEAPGKLDGGDVLLIERHALIGVSERSNPEGAEQLGEILEDHGFTWTAVPVAEGLHFKSSVNWVGGRNLLVTEDFAGMDELEGFRQIVVDPTESYAANVLWINGTLIVPAGYPGTRKKLEVLGLPILELDTSEARQMDGGLTCMSLRF
jgi:dimethylargininase